MARFAMVHDATGFVANVVLLNADSGLKAPDGYSLVPDDPPAASPGGRWDGTEFLPPPGLEPMEVPEA